MSKFQYVSNEGLYQAVVKLQNEWNDKLIKEVLEILAEICKRLTVQGYPW